MKGHCVSHVKIKLTNISQRRGQIINSILFCCCWYIFVWNSVWVQAGAYQENLVGVCAGGGEDFSKNGVSVLLPQKLISFDHSRLLQIFV